MSREEQLREWVRRCQQQFTGDQEGEAQVFRDRCFVAFGHADGLKEAGATCEMPLPKTDPGGAAFAEDISRPSPATVSIP